MTTGEYFRLADIVKPRDLIRDVVSDGGYASAYLLGSLPKFRKVTSEYKATWSAQKRMRIFDRRQINGQLAAKLSAVRPANLQFDVKAFATAVKEAMANPDPDLFTPYLDVQLFPVLGGGTACLFTYDAVWFRFDAGFGWQIFTKPECLVYSVADRESYGGAGRIWRRIIFSNLSSYL